MTDFFFLCTVCASPFFSPLIKKKTYTQRKRSLDGYFSIAITSWMDEEKCVMRFYFIFYSGYKNIYFVVVIYECDHVFYTHLWMCAMCM